MKNKKTKTTKKTYRKKRNYKKKNFNMLKELTYHGGLVPERYRCKLKNFAPFSVTFVSYVKSSVYFTINAITPTVWSASTSICTGTYNMLGSQNTGGGATGLYGNYIVHSCKLTVEPQTTFGANTQQGIVWTLYPLPQNVASDSLTIFQINDLPGAVHCVTPSSSETSAIKKRLYKTFYPHRLQGTPEAAYLSAPANWGNYNTAPSAITNVQLCAGTSGGNTDAYLAGACDISWEIDVTFFNRNILNTATPT